MLWKTIVKIFLHGLSFWLLSVSLLLGWFILTLALASIGYILGLMVGFSLLFLIIGYGNSMISRHLWSTSSNPSLTSHFFHGLLLLAFVAGVNFVLLVSLDALRGALSAWLLTFVVGVFLSGLICRELASWFKKSEAKPVNGLERPAWETRLGFSENVQCPAQGVALPLQVDIFVVFLAFQYVMQVWVGWVGFGIIG